MDAHAAFVDQILISDRSAPKKQGHTLRRIFERLRDERGFEGGYTTVRDFVRPRRQHLKEAFVPLSHSPGHAQADFGEATVVLGGVEQRVRRHRPLHRAQAHCHPFLGGKFLAHHVGVAGVPPETLRDPLFKAAERLRSGRRSGPALLRIVATSSVAITRRSSSPMTSTALPFWRRSHRSKGS